MRLLPDGCLDLVWDGRHARLARPADRQVRRPVGDTALVTGIRIRPGWAAIIAGTSVRHLPEATDLTDVWDLAAARQLAAALAAAASPAALRAVLTTRSRAAWPAPAAQTRESSPRSATWATRAPP